MRRRHHPDQPSLLDWRPAETVIGYPEEGIRARSMEERYAKGIAITLQSIPHSRAEIARRMSEYLGRSVSINMVNAYASPGRPDHQISLPRFAALVHATEDRRLVELLTQPMGWATIERRYLPLIELAAVHDRQEQLRKHAETLRRQARVKGAL